MRSPAQLDWSLLRSFLAVAETGSLSSAGRQLSLTQPTLGRQIRLLEAAVGTHLFQRHARGLELTETGRRLLPAAREMKRSAAELALALAGQSQSLAGTVRITASVVVSHSILPPILAQLRGEHPDIQLELVPDDSTENLLFREADIAVRMYRPEQLELVATLAGEAVLALYAARRYLKRRGLPKTESDLQRYDFVGFDRSERIIDVMRERGWNVTRDFFGVRCDQQAVYWELGRAGCGIVANQTIIGDRDPAMRRVLPSFELGSMPYWVAVPEALKNTPRVRAVYDTLVQSLRNALGRAEPNVGRVRRR